MNKNTTRILPFTQAADQESVKIFFDELKIYLSDLQRTIESSFIGTKAAFNDFDQHCEFYLYEELFGDEGDDCEHRICSFEFVLDNNEISCIGEPVSWTPDQKELCFKQISYLVMRELSDHDQRHVNEALERFKPTPDNPFQRKLF